LLRVLSTWRLPGSLQLLRGSGLGLGRLHCLVRHFEVLWIHFDLARFQEPAVELLHRRYRTLHGFEAQDRQTFVPLDGVILVDDLNINLLLQAKLFKEAPQILGSNLLFKPGTEHGKLI